METIVTDEKKILRLNGVDLIEVLSPQETEKKIKLTAIKMAFDYHYIEQKLIIIFIANGGIYWGVDLARELQDLGFNHTSDTMLLSRYSGDGETKEPTTFELKGDITNRDVILLDDVIEDGDTIEMAYDYLKSKKPKSLEVCVLVEKCGHKELKFRVKYAILRNIKKVLWLVGMGMDSKFGLRALRGIYAYSRK